MAKSKIKYTSAKDWAEKQDKGFDAKSVKLPDGVTFFSFKKVGIYRLNIIPYVVGKGNPEAEEGFAHPCRTYYAHGGLGPEGKDKYVCRLKTFGKKCPVCEWLMQKGGSADKELVTKLRAKTRQLWNVLDMDNPDAGIQVMDQSYFMSFGENLKELIDSNEEEYENWFQLDGGYSVTVKVKEKTAPFGTIKAISRLDFVPRKKPLPEKLIEEAVCLDECLVDVGYDELKKVFLQEPDDEDDAPVRNRKEEEDEDETPVVKKRKSVTEDDEDDEDEPLPRKGRSRVSDEEDTDDDDDESDSEDEEDSSEDEDDEEVPARKKTVARKSKDDDDEDEQDEDDEPAPRRSSRR